MLEHSFDEPSCLYRLAPTNTLWLLQGDARESLDQELGAFDAIYFDAFSPATNPNCGTSRCSEKFCRCSSPMDCWSATASAE